MKRDFVQLVAHGYDQIARQYLAWREEEPLLFREELQDLANSLPPNARVLDAGCGAGVPVTQFLSEKFHVTGVDISREQIALAHARVPAAEFIQGDMVALDALCAPESFDAVTCIYALIHVPRERHTRVLENFQRVLKRSGYLLLIAGNNDTQGDTDNFFGTAMYWSHFDRATGLQMIRAAGFEIIWDKVVSDRPSGSHVLVLARKNRPPASLSRER